MATIVKHDTLGECVSIDSIYGFRQWLRDQYETQEQIDMVNTMKYARLDIYKRYIDSLRKPNQITERQADELDRREEMNIE